MTDIKICPVCGTKDNLGVYLCNTCWKDFQEWMDVNHPDAEWYPNFLSEYLGKIVIKEKVEFT